MIAEFVAHSGMAIFQLAALTTFCLLFTVITLRLVIKGPDYYQTLSNDLLSEKVEHHE